MPGHECRYGVCRMSSKKYELVNTETGKKSVLEARSGTVGPDCVSVAGITGLAASLPARPW